MAQPLDNLRAAYQALERDVLRSLRTQIGDVARLQEQQHRAISYLQAAEQVNGHNSRSFAYTYALPPALQLISPS